MREARDLTAMRRMLFLRLSAMDSCRIVIEIVDLPDKIQAFLPVLDVMMDGGLATLEKVQVLHYRSHADRTT